MSIVVELVGKKYGDQQALDSVSFSVAQGEIVGLLGPNGAGKTTTMKILSGFITKFTGSAFVAGINALDDPLTLKQKIGYLPEHNPLYLEMYVREYLNFIAHVYRIGDRNKKIRQVIKQVGLAAEQHKKIRTLSKGYRQRVGLAQALIHNPEVLILDEPTSGLDPNQLVEIRQLIKNIGQEKTVIFSSHIMQEVQALCDRVIILNRGKVVADDKIDLLDQAINKEVEIVVELNQPLADWKLSKLIRVQEISETVYLLHFKKTGDDHRMTVFDYVVDRGRKILSMQEHRSSIEDVFQKLTV